MKRKALTLTEVLTGLAILSILTGVMMLNGNTVGQQTARREAERVAAFFRAHILRANMTGNVVWFDVKASTNTIDAKTGKEFYTPIKTDTLEAREKCSLSPALKLVYNLEKGVNNQSHTLLPAGASVDIGSSTTAVHCITVTGADGKTCYVRISK